MLDREIDFLEAREDERRLEVALFQAIVTAGTAPGSEAATIRDEIERRIRDGARWHDPEPGERVSPSLAGAAPLDSRRAILRAFPMPPLN